MKKMRLVLSVLIVLVHALIPLNTSVTAQEVSILYQGEYGTIYGTESIDEIKIVDESGIKYLLTAEDAVYILDENRNIIDSLAYVTSGETEACPFDEGEEFTTFSTTIDYRGCYVGANFIPYQSLLSDIAGIIAIIVGGSAAKVAGIAQMVLSRGLTGQNSYWRKCSTQYIPKYDTAFCQITTTFYSDAARTQYVSSDTTNNYGFPCSNLPFPY